MMDTFYLRDEGYQFPVMFSLFIGINFEYLANAVVMIPLLQELFLVRYRVSFDQVLQLGQVGCQQNASPHAGRGR